jgi:type I restriction enzyme S subunit
MATEKTQDPRIPEIRFSGFTDAWEQRKLGEFATKRIERNADGKITETFTNSAEHGVVSQLDFFSHDITNSQNIGNYYMVMPNDYVYNPRISANAPCGPINQNHLDRSGVMSPLYTVFFVDDTISQSYLSHFFKTSLWHPYMLLEGNNGARSDRFSISDPVFFNMPISCPSPREQGRIAGLLTALDSLISLHQREAYLLSLIINFLNCLVKRCSKQNKIQSHILENIFRCLSLRLIENQVRQRQPFLCLKKSPLPYFPAAGTRFNGQLKISYTNIFVRNACFAFRKTSSSRW